MIDFHSHILPKMDDGSKSCEMSLEMLKTSYEYGTSTIVATPHFYIKQNDVGRFLERRSKAHEELMEFISASGQTVPDIILGAEVYFFRGISHYDGLEKLAIGDTDYILIEMPFEKWTDRTIAELEAIKEEKGLKPMIAHIDRYLDYQKGTDNVEKLMGTGFTIQMNAEFVNSLFTRKKAIEMINNGMVDVLGTDCHNMDKRRPNMDKCMQILEKKCSADAVDDINRLGKEILGL